MWTKEGVKLSEISQHNDWVWTAKQRPGKGCIAIGDNSGSISCRNITFNVVHGLYKDRYAYRDTMTDIIVQHLITDRKVRIKCRDYVKKISVYRDRLAIQLPDKIIIYELAHEDAYDMRYRVKDKILQKFDCSSLLVISRHVILCKAERLQLFNFKGTS